MLAVISGMAFEARLAQGPRIETVWGLDAEKLTRDIESAIAKGATALLSFGVAAGLAPPLAPGAIIIAKHVRYHAETYTANAAWASALARQLPEATLADIAGVDSALTSVADKASLYKSCGAAAADMESHRMARVAQTHGLPFAALRVVLDDANCALPPAALAAAEPDGTISMTGLLGSLVLKPQQLPALLKLGSAEKIAKQALRRCGDLKGQLFESP